MESIGFEVSEMTVLQTITQDIVKSSQIEGELLDPLQVRSSVAKHLGMEVGGLLPADRNVNGIVEMTLDATQKYDQPLTKERILGWHASLFPTGYSGFKKINVGKWRLGAIQVVSEIRDKETIHFEGPDAEKVDNEMNVFLSWLNEEKEIDPILKSGIAHLWFLTIHPFDDGNGRIGRAIADLLLARSENSPHRFYSLSAQIQKERKDYYNILEKTQKDDLDITPWLTWFLQCLKRSIEHAIAQFGKTLEKSKFWERVNQTGLNERQRKMLNRLFDGFEGKLSTSKWAKINKCSQDTAYRDILDLMERGILVKSKERGPNTGYTLPNRIEEDVQEQG